MRKFWKKSDNSPSAVTLDKTFYDKFWEGFRDYLCQKNSSLKPMGNLYDSKNDYIRTYSGICFGHFYDYNSPVWFTGVTFSENDGIAAQFCSRNKKLLTRLKEDKESIEDYFGGEIDWSIIDIASRIGVDKKGANLKYVSNHPNLYEWLRQNLEKLEQVIMWKLASYYIDDNSD